MGAEERYYASSDEGLIRDLRRELEAVKGQIRHWKYLKEHYFRIAHPVPEALGQLEYAANETADPSTREHIKRIIGLLSTEPVSPGQDGAAPSRRPSTSPGARGEG